MDVSLQEIWRTACTLSPGYLIRHRHSKRVRKMTIGTRCDSCHTRVSHEQDPRPRWVLRPAQPGYQAARDGARHPQGPVFQHLFIGKLMPFSCPSGRTSLSLRGLGNRRPPGYEFQSYFRTFRPQNRAATLTFRSPVAASPAHVDLHARHGTTDKR